jgi:hypothetical protein
MVHRGGSMTRKLILPVLGLMLLASCQPGTPTGSAEAELATAVSATLASLDAVAPGDGKTAPGIEPTDTTGPALNQPEAVFSDWMIAYSDGSSIWVRIDGQPVVQVSTRGVILSLVLSDDGRYIVYGRSDERGEKYELRVVRSDGTDDRLLLDEASLDGLHLLDIALHIRPSQIDFLPGSHKLLMNTRAIFEGPGLAKYDDLFSLDAETGSLKELLEPGLGGDFYLSPDARRMVLVQPTSISIADVDGSNRQSAVITFEPVMTYSEYAYYPAPRWAPDSSRFGVVIPSTDPLAQNPTAVVWIAPADGGPAEQMATLTGQSFFAQSFGTSLLSPELLDLAFMRQPGQSNQVDLYLARVDGSAEQVYVSGDLAWVGWNPDSVRFVYKIQPDQYFLGSRGANPQSLGQGRALQWVDMNTYLLLAGQVGSWQLNRIVLGQASSMIAISTGISLIYDFLP